MVEFPFIGTSDDIASGSLLDEDEVVAVVDDAPEIVRIVKHRLLLLGFPAHGCYSAEEMFALFSHEKVALVLLDINLPDSLGYDLLETLTERDHDLGIVMITARGDLQMALDCIRAGADDYLTKPLSLELLDKTITTTLAKRRLVIENRRFQKALQRFADERQFLYRLGQAMNNAFLAFHELDRILRTILVGITAQEGLGFNRAFLLLFEPDGSLRGRMAIGPASPEEAGKVWGEIAAKGLSFDDILYTSYDGADDSLMNKVAREMTIPASMSDHVVMVAGRERISIVISNGRGEDGVNTYDLPTMLGCDHFIVTPLISPHKAIGVIIADNCITGAMIGENDIRRLEMFASQASLAIERSRLHEEMKEKISELEKVTRELARSRDQIVEMERYSAIGHMTAQLAHDIRNPLTCIGAAASWLIKKTDEPRYYRFLEIIVKEAGRIESTLQDMSAGVSASGLSLERHGLTSLVDEALLALRPELQTAAIACQFIHPEEEIAVSVDAAKMREAFLLLIKNGIIAMPDGGLLRIEISHGDSKAMVTFRQNFQNQEAELFHDTLAHKLALGLAVAKPIIARHGGNVVLDLQEEGNAVATVTLPEA